MRALTSRSLGVVVASTLMVALESVLGAALVRLNSDDCVSVETRHPDGSMTREHARS